MNRRVITAALLVLISIVVLARPTDGTASAQDAPVTISIATLAPPGSTWMRVFDAWNREVRRRSNRTLQLRFYPGGVQGDESEVIRKIRNGRIDGAAVTAVGLAQIHRPALVFQIPGIFRTYAQLDRAREALNGEMTTAIGGAGFHLMGWADVGQSRIFSRSPIRTPQELAASRPWVWRDDSVLPALFQVVHANPVALQLPEVLSALQTNRINTVVTTPVACIALQWCSRVTYMTDDNAAVVIGATVIGNRKWDALSPANQTIMTETAAQFHALARRNLRNDERTGLTALAARGIQSVPLNAAQRAAWQQVFNQVRQRLTGQIADAALITRVQGLAH